jgi:putative membrane-bound dehydrogenase-like protein
MPSLRSVTAFFAAIPWWAGTVVSADPFPVPNDTQPLIVPLPSAQESLAKMKLPEGFRATVFAAEPDVNNPIACCWDDRGRLWVAENFTYGDGDERFNLGLRDRILVFEDSDNDGVHDRRTVFTDQVQMLTSIERGLGGVWAMAPPHLLFFPDANGDDVPDGPPQVVLDGFSTEAASRHTFANGLKWGPDGWLYGRIGISSTSYIGRPGTQPDQRLGTAGGLWRYHPVHKVVDVVCAGTTNPWGHDWDENGELFFINTVIGHLWHGAHGAHFKRMHGLDLNPRVYQQIDQIADHYHWDTGGTWQDSRPEAPGAATSADSLGGGHAHVGLMIYQGTNWPASYRGKLFTTNLHGRRVNVERLEPSGSSHVGRHEPDMLKTGDVWFRGIELTYGPDGGVYILDWSDLGECHENDGVHRNSGRIYKITHGIPSKPPETDMSALDGEALARVHLSDNEWLVRMARWHWRERRHRGGDLKAADAALARLVTDHPSPRLRRQALWTQVFAGFGDPKAGLEAALEVPELRPVGVSLLGDSLLLASRAGRGPAALSDPVRQRLLAWAGEQGTPSLRLKLASFAIKNPEFAVPLLERLLHHGDDAKDPFLPLMYWYALMDAPPAQMAPLFAECQLPLVRRFVARRCAEDIEKDPAPLNQLLASGAHSSDLLAGMVEALDGWAKAPRPSKWPSFTATLTDPTLRAAAQSLDVVFGDGRALDDIKKIVFDHNADLPRRESALRSLVTARADGLKDLCRRVLTTHGLSSAAMQGLALFDDPEVGRLLARSYAAFYPHEQQSLINTLTTRPVFAEALLDHLAAGTIPKSALTAAQARQIRALGSEALDQKLSAVWGEIRESSADTQAKIAELKSRLTPEALAQADPRQGRAVFNQACASCHKLYGEGQLIGPDLTGSGRHDINYLVENIVDPSALLAADYRMTIVTMTDGRVFSGNVAGQSERTLTLKMVGAEQTLERRQIVKTEQLPLSLMPEGLLQSLSETQVRDLFAYLMTSAQVDLP